MPRHPESPYGGHQDMHPVRHPHSLGPVPPPCRAYHGPCQGAPFAWSGSVPGDHELGPATDVCMPPVLSSTQASNQDPRRQQKAAPAIGCDAHSDLHTGGNAPARFAHTQSDADGIEDPWKRLLKEFRGDQADHARERAQSSESVVGLQPPNGVFLPQNDRQAGEEVRPSPIPSVSSPFFKHVWVVNTCDWIDVEYVLRKMLRCESSDCHHFQSVGYIFFRSCALSHVMATPREEDLFLQAGVLHRFPGTEVVVEVLQAHPQGVLEIGCYLEYVPLF